jgi:hypothetical protein
MAAVEALFLNLHWLSVWCKKEWPAWIPTVTQKNTLNNLKKNWSQDKFQGMLLNI